METRQRQQPTPTQRGLNPKTPNCHARTAPRGDGHHSVPKCLLGHFLMWTDTHNIGEEWGGRLVGLEGAVTLGDCQVHVLGSALAVRGHPQVAGGPQGRSLVNLGCCESGQKNEHFTAGRGLGDQVETNVEERRQRPPAKPPPSPPLCSLVPKTLHSVPKGSPGKSLPLPEEGVTHLVTVTRCPPCLGEGNTVHPDCPSPNHL